MKAEPGSEGAIPVHSVAEEYIYLRKQRCSCGGTLRVVTQMLYERAGQHFDVLHVRCPRCGARMAYTFDISSFYDGAAKDAQ